MTGNTPRRLRYLSLLLALPFALPAQTQSVVEEIVAFATKREASIQGVPIAVSAYSAEQLQRARTDEPTQSKSRSTLAAQMKSFSDRPPMAWVFHRQRTLP